MKDSLLKNFLVNIRALLTTNIRRRLNENSNRLTELEDVVFEMERSLDKDITAKFHFLNLMDYYARHVTEAAAYQKELEYLGHLGSFCFFPYEDSSDLIDVESGFDKTVNLPYVVHKNKKLYFRVDFTLDMAIGMYKSYVNVEKLLGDGEGEEAPHQYQSPRVHVDEGDVVIDIGAAEGLFALDQIDKASRVVIVENDPRWFEPLRNTFAPYGDKIKIIQKSVSALDTEATVSLGKLLSDEDFNSAFVKMDIEGCELSSIISSESILRKNNGIKLSVASYHKQNDAEEMRIFFDKIGYSSEFSDGYMLFNLYDTPAPPYFRKGIVRAKRLS